MIRRPPRSTLSSSSAASDVYKRQTPGRAVVWVGSDPPGYACALMDDDLTALVVADARGHMAKAVDHTQAEFGAIRTGRATPALVEHLKIEYYGTETELRQMAGFSVPEARLLVVSPYDLSLIH